MTIPRIRGGSSGPAIQPLPGKGSRLYGPSSGPLVVTLQPANHPRGFYNLHVAVFTTTTGVGTYTSAYEWDQDGFGPATLAFGAINLATVAGFLTVSRAIYSSGLAPITFTITPAGVSGAPILNVIGMSELIAVPVPT